MFAPGAGCSPVRLFTRSGRQPRALARCRIRRAAHFINCQVREGNSFPMSVEWARGARGREASCQILLGQPQPGQLSAYSEISRPHSGQVMRAMESSFRPTLLAIHRQKGDNQRRKNDQPEQIPRACQRVSQELEYLSQELEHLPTCLPRLPAIPDMFHDIQRNCRIW